MNDLFQIFIILIPLVFLFLYLEKKKVKDNSKRREYNSFLEEKQYTPPDEIDPFLAAYLSDSFISYSDMTVLLYNLLEKRILSVAEIGEKEYDRDFVFIFKKDLKESYELVNDFEQVMIDALWFGDKKFPKNKFLKYYPNIEIKYPLCRMSKIKFPKKKLKKLAKKEFQKMGILNLKPKINFKNILLYLLFSFVVVYFASFSEWGEDKFVFGIFLILLGISYLYYWKYIKIHLNRKGIDLKNKLESFKNYLALTKKDKFKTIRTLETLKNEEYHIKYFSYMLAFKIVSHNLYTNRMSIGSVWYDKRKLTFEQDIQRIFKKLKQK